MTKKDNEDFRNSAEYCICDNVDVNSDVKVKDNCHITGKHRGYAHRDCNIKVKVNRKILVVFYNLKNYHSHLMKQELG